MRFLINKFLNVNSVYGIRRLIHKTTIKETYEGDGKTTVTFLSRDADYGLMINKYGPHGFTLNSGVKIYGPMVIFPRTVLGWNIASSQDINEESLTLFTILEPSLEMLIIGMDDQYHPQARCVQTIRSVLRNANIRYEILPVTKACSVFNFLNGDERYIAAALVPPKLNEISAISVKQNFT